MRETVDIAALNSRVKFDRTDVPFDKRAILGDATETGLIRFAGRYLPDFDEHQKKHPKVFEIPFNSTNKWALVIVSKIVLLVCSRSLIRCDIGLLVAQQTACCWYTHVVHQGSPRTCVGEMFNVSEGRSDRPDNR